MLIETTNLVDTENLSNENLLSYLSQVVLCKTDEEMKIREDKIKFLRHEMNEKKKSLRETKNRLIHVYSESKRLDALSDVLELINTLNKEGVLIGKNRVKIFRLLDDINEQSFQKLRTLEERLSIYLPRRNRISIS